MTDLTVAILFALDKPSVLFVVEAPHKSMSVLAEQNGRSVVSFCRFFVSQRCVLHSEWGGADWTSVRFSANAIQSTALYTKIVIVIAAFYRRHLACSSCLGSRRFGRLMHQLMHTCGVFFAGRWNSPCDSL